MSTEEYTIGYREGEMAGWNAGIHSVKTQPQLTVRLRSYPESNGRRNWTADFVRVEPFKGLIGTAGGIAIGHGELWNRVAYAAERARFLLGERATEPSIREYGADVQTPAEWTGNDPEAVFNKKEPK